MTLRNLLFIFISIAIVGFNSCAICIGGGELKVKKNYVYNNCGLLNGVSVSEIQVDSFQNSIPTKCPALRVQKALTLAAIGIFPATTII